jgi:hypothetical protein
MKMMKMVGFCLGAVLMVGTAQAEDGWISLFNGKDKSGWHLRNPNGHDSWTVQDGALVNTPPAGGHGTDLISDLVFWNFELETDFMVPAMNENSGIYLRGRYEIQVLGDYGRAPSGGGCGSIYQLQTASANPSKKPGEWNHVRAVVIEDIANVWINDIQVIKDCKLSRATGSELDRNYQLLGPIFLQGDHGRVAYKNIRVKPIEDNYEGSWIKAFNGKDKTGWQPLWDREDTWKVVDGALVNLKQGGNDIRTVRDDFFNQKLHLEFKIDKNKNSGVYLRGNYEVQVFGNFGKEDPSIHDAGAIYGKIAPRVNSLTSADEWQILDVVMIQDPEKGDVPWMEVVLNHEVVIPWQRVEQKYETHPALTTGGPMKDDPKAAGPLRFQGDHDQVAFQNIWIQPIAE